MKRMRWNEHSALRQGGGGRRHCKSAFTLLEILLVVLVIGILAGAFLPPAIESIEGVRLRAATRDVISLTRYARARAVLDQRPVALLYDRDGGVVELLQLPPQDLPFSLLMDAPPARLLDAPGLGGEGIRSLRRRQLSAFVTVQEVRGAELEGDTWFVVFQPSGMTDPHTVVLRDNRGDLMRIVVNGMTGDIRLGEQR